MAVTLTKEEIISTLQRSQLNSILIEGKDDKIVFDYIVEKIEEEDILIDVFPCGGRDILIELSSEVNTFSAKTFFFCDADMWIFDENRIPESIKEKNNIYITQGYSIENDLFIEGKEILFSYLKPDERVLYEQLLETIAHWFSYQTYLYLNVAPAVCSYSDKNVCNPNFINCNDLKINDEAYQAFDHETNNVLVEKIMENKEYFTRGKFLFQIFTHIFNTRGKQDRNAIKYSTAQLFDICTKELWRSDQSVINNHINKLSSYFS